MALSTKRQGSVWRVKTPDGKDFSPEASPKPLASAGIAVFAALKGVAAAIGVALMVLLRALWKFIITTWRLAAALDSALWRGCKLLWRRVVRAGAHALGLITAALGGFLEWLPTRTGRAYSAVSGIVLLIAGLWLVDQLRNSPGEAAEGGLVNRPPIDLEDPILARIDGRYVHLSEIEAAARAGGFLRPGEALSSESAFGRELVESYVEQRLLASAARDNGLHRQSVVSRRVNAARDRVLASAFMEAQIDDSVTPQLVERLYDEQADIARLGEEVRARHIVVATKEEADELLIQLAEGADFNVLAKEHSIDPITGRLGGEVGWFTREMMTKAFSRSAFSTAEGELSDPFETEFGWHILEVTGQRSGQKIPFSDVQGRIEEFLRLRTIESTLSSLEDDAQVVYYRPIDEAPSSAPAPEIPLLEQENVDEPAAGGNPIQ